MPLDPQRLCCYAGAVGDQVGVVVQNLSTVVAAFVIAFMSRYETSCKSMNLFLFRQYSLMSIYFVRSHLACFPLVSSLTTI